MNGSRYLFTSLKVYFSELQCTTAAGTTKGGQTCILASLDGSRRGRFLN